MNAQAQTMSPAARNFAARNLILRGGQVGPMYFPPAIDMWQPQPVVLPASPGPGTVLSFNIRNVGLVKRLVFFFRATVTAPAAQVQTLTPVGLANFISNVTLWDLGNNQRINTTGWHLTAVSSAKRRGVFGAAYTTDTPLGYGNNNNRVMFAPATIAGGANSEIDFYLEVPLVKSDTDLRGAIYADVTQANMQVQVTLNPNMFVTSTADRTLAVYQSAGANPATMVLNSVQMYQNYLDQLPRDPSNGMPILPELDIGTAYLLNNSASALPVANQDNAASFTNARTFESVAFIYNNAGTLNVNGSDLNYIQLQSANFTNILNVDGRMESFMERNLLGADFPAGMHYLNFSQRPIDTNQFGNMTLVINPSTVGGATAVILYGWESFGIIGLVNQGGSIPSGGSR
jgi:hypothetical protein